MIKLNLVYENPIFSELFIDNTIFSVEFTLLHCQRSVVYICVKLFLCDLYRHIDLLRFLLGLLESVIQFGKKSPTYLCTVNTNSCSLFELLAPLFLF